MEMKIKLSKPGYENPIQSEWIPIETHGRLFEIGEDVHIQGELYKIVDAECDKEAT